VVPSGNPQKYLAQNPGLVFSSAWWKGFGRDALRTLPTVATPGRILSEAYRAAGPVKPRAVVLAENRAKVQVIQAKMAVNDKFKSAADGAGRVVEVAQGAVNKLKTVYIVLGLLAAAYLVAQVRALMPRSA
jgi:hypothetical protein